MRDSTAGLQHQGFDALFRAAFGGGEGESPYAWQRAFAEGEWPEVLVAPTGSGKTAGVALGWLHGRLRGR